jgi:Glutaminase A six helical-hairpin domain/Domain of unknown function (DUF5127)/Domain of unknown function (DUF4964)
MLMNKAKGIGFILASAILLAILPAPGKAQAFRPPAVPLVTYDPYFSIWSFDDHLTDGPTRHWTGTRQALDSLVRIDGKVYRLMGNEPAKVPALAQRELQVWFTRTVYTFEGAGMHLVLTFLTPLLPQNLEIYSRPVTYLTWEARAADGRLHSVELYFDASAELAVNNPGQAVNGGSLPVKGLKVLRLGSRDQPVLAKKGDRLRIDWGFLYGAAPEGENPRAALAQGESARGAFAQDGRVPLLADAGLPRPVQQGWPVMAFSFDLGKVGTSPVSRHLLLAYDDVYSLEYLHQRLRPYWRRNGAEAPGLLAKAEEDYSALARQCAAFDAKLLASMRKIGGEKYALLGALSYRQSLAAQKLVAGPHGQPYFFPKENSSNGCIGTVDVIYPEAPLLLLLNPKLMEATLAPVFDYAQGGRWHFPFAPHDLGTYPLANGQVYGGGEKTATDQMPVEESGNMILLTAALASVEGNASFAAKYWTPLSQWARYLKHKGLDPESQLCTDDFAGHLAHNANLSLKAILALEAYSRLAQALGHDEEAADFHQTAQTFAAQWVKMANDGDHFRLAFDKPGTWSEKYNLVWDKVLEFDLFPPAVARKELAFYLAHLNRYGLPLDSRKDYTKLDWEIWTATLGSSPADFASMVGPIFTWANETASRVPLSDLYDTRTGKQVAFQARSVVGGVFMKMLSERAVWQEWAEPQD